MDYIRSETEQWRRRRGGKVGEDVGGSGGIISQKATNIPCLVPDSIASLLPRRRRSPPPVAATAACRRHWIAPRLLCTYLCTYIICIVRSYLVSMCKSHQNFFDGKKITTVMISIARAECAKRAM